MSNKDWNMQQTTKQLSRVELTNSIQVIIPDDVRDKIKFLCKQIAKDEWSGVLFYEVTGSMKNVAKMVFTLKDILLMDRGNSVYTSFDWDEDIVNYQMDNPEALDWKIGHIHSHNTMKVFFSGTDWSELNDNCPLHNVYLSVIVNNYLDITGKVAFTGQSMAFTCKDVDGKDYTLKLSNTTEEPTMLVYDCNFRLNHETLKVADSFAERIKQVEIKVVEKRRREVEAAAKARTSDIRNPAIAKKNGYEVLDLRNKQHRLFPDYNGKAHKQVEEAWGKEPKIFEEEDDDFTVETIEQEFATYLLRLGNNEGKIDDELIEALEDIEMSDINIQAFSVSVTDSYGALYDKFFEKLPKFHGDDAFMDVLEQVIIALEEHEADYTFLNIIIPALKSMGAKFETFKQQNEEHEERHKSTT